MTKITIGARGSKLSIAYVEKVKKLLIQRNKDLNEGNIYFKAIKTSGDINQNIKLSEIGGKKLFCKEIEEKLLNKEIDIAVHSLKDMETEEDEKLIIGAYIKRNDFRDVIISTKIKSLAEKIAGIVDKDCKIKVLSGDKDFRDYRASKEKISKRVSFELSSQKMFEDIDDLVKKMRALDFGDPRNITVNWYKSLLNIHSDMEKNGHINRS